MKRFLLVLGTALTLSATAQKNFEGVLTYGIKAEVEDPMQSMALGSMTMQMKVGPGGMKLEAGAFMFTINTIFRVQEPYVYIYTSMDDKLYRSTPDAGGEAGEMPKKVKGDSTICGQRCEKYLAKGENPGETIVIWAAKDLKFPDYFKRLTGEDAAMFRQGSGIGVPLLIRARTSEGTMEFYAKEVKKQTITQADLALPKDRTLVDGRPE